MQIKSYLYEVYDLTLNPTLSFYATFTPGTAK